MADVQLDELGQGENRLHVHVVESVARVHLDACFIGKACGLDEA